MKKLAFIGAGKMAEALVNGVLLEAALAPEQIIAAEIDPNRRAYMAGRYRIETTDKTADAVARSEFIFLAVKPQHLDEAVAAAKGALDPDKTIISIAAGVPTARIRKLIDIDLPIVRVMPNTPALVGRGISAVALPEGLAETKRAFVDGLLKAVGEVVYVSEDRIDAVTAVSGSGPAYFFLFTSQLAVAGAAAGLPEETARRLARETFIGAARLLDETELTEAELIDAVASKGGTTEAALIAFNEADLGGAVKKAVAAALVRARELAQD